MTTATQTTMSLYQIQDTNDTHQRLLRLDADMGGIHPAMRERLGLVEARKAVKAEIKKLGAEINAYLEGAGVEGRRAAKAAGVWHV